MDGQLHPVDQMHLEGLAMKRQQFRRKNPEATDAEIEQMLRDWINSRPLDSPGRVRTP